MPDKPEPCGCMIRKGILESQCEYHKNRDKLVQLRTTVFLKAKIMNIFKDTHLYSIRDEILEELKRLSK